MLEYNKENIFLKENMEKSSLPEISKERKKKILIFALKTGEMLMQNGAEIYRIEDTIARICNACGIPYAEAFVTTTGIFLSLDDGNEASEIFTFQKRIRGANTNLDKISKINQMSRDLVENRLSLEQGIEKLNEISKEEPYPFAVRAFGAALTASFFALMFGGEIEDFFVTAVIGALSYGLSVFFEKIESNYFIKGFCSTAFATFLTIISIQLKLGINMDAIIIGTLMIFVPGMAITNAIRDFLTGDTISGIARTVEAFFIAVSLAVGVGIVLRLWIAMGGVL